MYFVSSYANMKTIFMHAKKDELSCSSLLKNKKPFFELSESRNYLVIEYPDIIMDILTSENGMNHYIIEYVDTEYLHCIDENTFKDMYENNKKIYYVSNLDRESCEIYPSVFGITKQIKHGRVSKNAHVINDNKLLYENDIIKIFDYSFRESFQYSSFRETLEYCFLNNKIKIFSHNNILIIYICGFIFVYDLKFEKMVEHLIIEKYIYKMFQDVQYIQKINEHQYFMIICLKEKHSIYNTILENFKTQVWTIYSKTLSINNYHDTCFHFV